MKILHVTSHLNVGGISRYILSLSERLVLRGHQVVVASSGGHLEASLRQAGGRHWKVPFRTSSEISPQVLKGTLQLIARLRQEPLDLLHAHTRVGQIAAEGVWRTLGIPYLATWHGIYSARLGRRLWPCTGKITIAISEPVRQHLVKDFHVPEERIRRIYNGIDIGFYAVSPAPAAVGAFRNRWGIPEGCPLIGAVGRLAAGRVKGFDTLLVAVSLLAESFPDLHVLIAGDGPRRPFLEDVARRLGISDRMHFVGLSEDIRVPLFLMDVFVFSSRWPEAFGLTLVEAMAAGKPVVATRVGAVPEILRHGEDGWLVPPDDPEAMAAGIAQLLKDRALAQRFGRQARIRAEQTFNLDQMTDQVEAVYRELA